ncbi:DNA-directed RNA polymerase III subunit RPC3 [Chamberlinius hualienensis]
MVEKYECIASLLRKHFGDVVEKVGKCLMNESLPTTLIKVCQATKLQNVHVRRALCILIEHHMVIYRRVGNRVEYKLDKDEVIAILRYPRYLECIKTKYDTIGESIVMKLLYRGKATATNVIKIVAADLKDTQDGSNSKIKDVLFKLINKKYICRVLKNENGDPRTFADSQREGSDLYKLPIIDMSQFDETNSEDDKTDNVYWRVNHLKLDHCLRDQLFVFGIEKSIDKAAANIVRCILKLAGFSGNWVSISHPISKPDIIRELKKINVDCPFIDNYLGYLVDDSSKIITKLDDHQGGMYVVNFKECVNAFTWSFLENIVHERYGWQYLRIFRILKSVKYAEQKQIEELVMLPVKEARCTLHKLFIEHIVSIKEFVGVDGYFYHINLPLLVGSFLDFHYKTVSFLMVKQTVECNENKKLLEKEAVVKNIIESLNSAEEVDQEQVKAAEEIISSSEKEQLKYLKQLILQSEVGLDSVSEGIFLFEQYWYLNLCQGLTN